MGVLAGSVGLTVAGGCIGGAAGLATGECLECGSAELFMMGAPAGAVGGAVAADKILN